MEIDTASAGRPRRGFKRLTPFQWALVAAALCWAFGAGIHQRHSDVERATGFVDFAYKACLGPSPLPTTTAKCAAEGPHNFAVWMQGSWGNVAFLALLPIPCALFVGFVLVYMWRIAKAGFREVVRWSTLTFAKRIVVVSCFLVTGAAAVFGIVVVLNLYVDTQVPVGLSPFLDVNAYPGYATAEGTWIRSGASAGSALADPLQVSHIECIQEESKCTEARAEIATNADSGSVLMVDLITYPVQSWTDSTIVFINDEDCASEVFTMDLLTKSVSGAGHVKTASPALCPFNKDADQTWSYRLSAGFPIYWEQRQKARPLMLRLIQTLFGN